MKTNYHNERVEWRAGQAVAHVTDEGAIVTGKITDIEDGLLCIEFDDGEAGWEKPETCF